MPAISPAAWSTSPTTPSSEAITGRSRARRDGVAALVLGRQPSGEALLATDIRLAFFIPVIVYLSDAVGTQTETIYVRNLAEGKIRFLQYLTKETLVGVGLGVIFGLLLYAGALLWLHSKDIALAIGLSTLINLSVAPFLAVIIPSLLYRERTDPALGAGPLATIIQDLASLVVYFLIASAIVL